jgi:hypothetical protein
VTVDQIRLEPKVKRGCGYRKLGGLYLVSDGPAHECGLLPRALSVCPCCNEGVKQKIGWSWAQARMVLQPDDVRGCGRVHDHQLCDPLCGIRNLAADLERKVGLIWVGAKFYPTPADFVHEGIAQGISRRIGAVPKGFEVGTTWVLLAHPKAIPCSSCNGAGRVHVSTDVGGSDVECADCAGVKAGLGIFGLFRPTRIEQLISREQAEEEGFLARLEQRGITPMLCDANDPDHNPSAANGEEGG